MSRTGPPHRGTGPHPEEHDDRWCSYCAAFEDGVDWATEFAKRCIAAERASWGDEESSLSRRRVWEALEDVERRIDSGGEP